MHSPAHLTTMEWARPGAGTHVPQPLLCANSTVSPQAPLPVRREALTLVPVVPSHPHVLCVPDSLKSQPASKGGLRTK